MSPPGDAHPATLAVRRTIGAQKRSVFRRALRWIVPLVLLAAAVFAFRALRARAANRGPTFVSEPARRADVQVTVTATGTLEAVTTVEVGAEVTGRILELKAGENDRVKKGQVLAVIDPEQLQAAVAQAAAQVASAEATILQAKATVTESGLALERAKKLREQGLLGQSDLDTATATKQRADANLASAAAGASLARAALKSAKSRLDKATIYSPIDGVVLARLVELGQTVTAGFTTPVLFRLAEDLTRMQVKAAIDEADVGRVRAGEEASFTVEAYPERKFPSSVKSLGNDPKTSSNVVTYQAILVVDNSEKLLRPGMTCNATIVADTKKDVLVVPNAALRFTPPAQSQGPPEKKAATVGEPKKHVWVLDPATPRPVPRAIEVKTGATDGLVTEIVSGEIKPGTEVLVDVKEQP
jgi:HlyD family secretion protein